MSRWQTLAGGSCKLLTTLQSCSSTDQAESIGKIPPGDDSTSASSVTEVWRFSSTR